MTHRPVRDGGASALEYGLIAGGVVAAFLIAFVGLQAAVGAVFGRVVSSVEQPGPAPSAIPGGARSQPVPEATTGLP
ncbi:Flp family type IVb pilin [Kineosporia babensis]|uniref:Flp family type IVb pilin n=1 Tax=Kineosporia babensis TaxID=499548 RepID=A0A9X1NJE8_9ACTN|nr:Flp family type IVb pilin [Kineosporia babensis]MCD5314674.1 Flp family type IVb pilin [Kineosporia babensis]